MALNVEHFRKELVYDAEAPVPAVLADLSQFLVLDKHAEKRRSEWSTVVVICAAAAVVLAFSLLFIPVFIVLTGPLLALSAIGFFVSYAFYSRQQRLDLEDRRYQLAERLLLLLQADIAPIQPISLHMDFRRPFHESKLHGTGKVGAWDVKYFVDPWLSLRGRLLDGTHFQLHLTEKLQRRSRWKRSSSGKSKHKSKEKSSTVAALRLRVKASRHPQLARLASRARGAVQLPPGTSIVSLEVQDDALSLLVSLPSAWGPDAAGVNLDASRVLAMMFLSLYQVLNHSRALDGAPQRSAG